MSRAVNLRLSDSLIHTHPHQMYTDLHSLSITLFTFPAGGQRSGLVVTKRDKNRTVTQQPKDWLLGVCTREKRTARGVCDWVTSLYNRTWRNIVNQLYFNNKIITIKTLLTACTEVLPYLGVLTLPTCCYWHRSHLTQHSYRVWPQIPWWLLCLGIASHTNLGIIFSFKAKNGK